MAQRRGGAESLLERLPTPSMQGSRVPAGVVSWYCLWRSTSRSWPVCRRSIHGRDQRDAPGAGEGSGAMDLCFPTGAYPDCSEAQIGKVDHYRTGSEGAYPDCSEISFSSLVLLRVMLEYSLEGAVVDGTAHPEHGVSIVYEPPSSGTF